MIPSDLSGFTVEQLRGFAVVVRQQIDALQAAKVEGNFTVDQLGSFEGLVNDQNRLADAIQLATDADEAEAAVEEAVAEAATPADGEDDEDAEAAPAATPDAETVVDEAVASMTLGGGDAPRVTRDASDKGGDSEMRKFVRHMARAGVSQEERHSFSTLRRETNHVAREGSDATEAIRDAIAARAAGTDKTAAGCFCGPDDAITAIKQAGETTRPISDTLPTLTASGDIRYIRQLDLAEALGGVTEWTCTDQDAVDPGDVSTWKPCFELDCQQEQTSGMYAVSACASFSTQQMIGNPELIANLEHVMEVAFSKTAELLVYNRLRDLSSKYSFGLDPVGYGASAQLLAAVGWSMELIHANLREKDPQYTLALPAGLIDRVITDGLIRGMDEYRVRADLFDRLDALGVAKVVELTDEIVASPAPIAHATLADPADPRDDAPAHPVEQEILLYRPEDFVLGVGPNIDLGVTRSPELARQNKLQWFTEGFEFVEKVGVAPALSLVVPFCASGIRPALGEGTDCVVEEG